MSGLNGHRCAKVSYRVPAEGRKGPFTRASLFIPVLPRFMKALPWITVGFLLPALLVTGLLRADDESDTWSGHSPLNYLYWIPVAYLVSLSLLLILSAIKRKRPSLRRYLALAGVASGLPLFLLPHQTASLLSGIEMPILVFPYACAVGLLWLSSKN